MSNENRADYKSGFVGIIGAPNVGKSTFLNRVLGEKVAITSDKPQTTRHRILGVATLETAQIIFTDTPGVHQADSLLNRELTAAALSVLGDADVILFMAVPGHRRKDENMVIKALKSIDQPVIVAINKIDQMKKEDLLPYMEECQKELNPKAMVPICALTGDGVPELLEVVTDNLSLGPQLYPPDTLTDQPERFIAAEMVREQVFKQTGQEIPYSTAVTVEEFKEDEEKNLIRINAIIHLERESQKGIVIGKNGSKLKEIGTESRKDIERMTGTKVYLELFVKVWKNWSKDPRAISEFGYKWK